MKAKCTIIRHENPHDTEDYFYDWKIDLGKSVVVISVRKYANEKSADKSLQKFLGKHLSNITCTYNQETSYNADFLI